MFSPMLSLCRQPDLHNHLLPRRGEALVGRPDDEPCLFPESGLSPAAASLMTAAFSNQ